MAFKDQFKPRDGETKEQHFARLTEFQQTKGYKPGWVGFIFQEAWGHWPGKDGRNDGAILAAAKLMTGSKKTKRIVKAKREEIVHVIEGSSPWACDE